VTRRAVLQMTISILNSSIEDALVANWVDASIMSGNLCAARTA
jgi:hypothetical protein